MIQMLLSQYMPLGYSFRREHFLYTALPVALEAEAAGAQRVGVVILTLPLFFCVTFPSKGSFGM